MSYQYNKVGELVRMDDWLGATTFELDLLNRLTKVTDHKGNVVDYTSATFNTLVMDEVGGFNYRWVYGLDKLSVKITSEGTNWWGQNVKQDILKDYCHQDRLGSTTNLTDQFGRVVGRADYNEWGQITYSAALSITSSYRRIWPQLSYTGHDWDDVLGMYYAKARFYSADDKRFVAMDPIKGNITEPLSLVPYVYCIDNPLRWVDPLGLMFMQNINTMRNDGGSGNTSTSTRPESIVASKSIEQSIEEEVAKAFSTQTLNLLSSAAEQHGNADAFMIGLASGITQAIEDLTIGNLINFTDHLSRVNTARASINLNPLIYSASEYEKYVDSTNSNAEFLAQLTGHPEAFYAGRMVADALMVSFGITAKGFGMAATVAGVGAAMNSGSAALIGAMIGGPGGAAVAGASDLAVGMVIAVGGVVATAAGDAVIQAAAGRLGHDAAKYKEYQDKAGCEGKGGTHDPKVDYDGRKCSVYRGGNDFTIKNGEIKIDKRTGNVKPTRGVSVNVDPNNPNVLNRGAYKIDYLPDGLEIIQTGTKDPGHFEIIPAYEMPVEQFQQLLYQIKTSPFTG